MKGEVDNRIVDTRVNQPAGCWKLGVSAWMSEGGISFLYKIRYRCKSVSRGPGD